MPTILRVAFLATLVAFVVACTGSGSSGSPSPGSPSPALPSSRPSAVPTTTPVASVSITHATGAADVILRYEEAGGFAPQAFLATQAPIFTLYGDGTVIFRNPAGPSPAPLDGIYRYAPFRTVRLSEDQVQTILAFAISEGGLGTARPNYGNDQVSDASTAVFTLDAGGLDKVVSIYALGIDLAGLPDAAARAGFAKLAERLAGFDRDGTLDARPYAPDRYRGSLSEGLAGAPGSKPWPWKDIRPTDFIAGTAPNAYGLPTRVLTIAQVEALGVDAFEGGIQGVNLIGPDGMSYSLSVRPLLPGEQG